MVRGILAILLSFPSTELSSHLLQPRLKVSARSIVGVPVCIPLLLHDNHCRSLLDHPNLHYGPSRALTGAAADIASGKLLSNDSLTLLPANQINKSVAASQQEACHGTNESGTFECVSSALGNEVSFSDSESYAGELDEDDTFSFSKGESIEMNITLFGQLGKSEAAISIYQILTRETWSSPETEGKLSSVVSKISAELVIEVIKLLRSGPVALSFLKWAKNQEGYEPRPEVYTHVIARFGRERDFNKAWNLLVEMKDCRLPIDYTFSIFLHRLKRAKRVRGVVKAMCGMTFLGVTPTIALYTCALDFLLKIGVIDDVMHLYKQMLLDALVPDRKLFEVLLVGFIKLGKVDDGLLLLEDMKNRGYVPHVSVYCVLISSLSVAKMPDKGHELFEEMLGNGSIPKVFGVNEIACALHGKDRGELLERILNLMRKTPYKYRIQSHNNLLQCLCECGNHIEAKMVFERVSQDEKARFNPGKGFMNYWNSNSYHIYITGMCKLGQLQLAMDVFKQGLEQHVKLSHQTSSILLLSLSNAKMIDEALDFCKHITSARETVSLDAQKSFFRALQTSGHLSVALKVFASMKRKGCVPDDADFISLIGLETGE